MIDLSTWEAVLLRLGLLAVALTGIWVLVVRVWAAWFAPVIAAFKLFFHEHSEVVGMMKEELPKVNSMMTRLVNGHEDHEARLLRLENHEGRLTVLEDRDAEDHPR